MPEIEIDGKTYIVKGDYPDGKYVKWLKPLSPPPETPIEIARQILQPGDKAALLGTSQGRALAAILKILIDV